MTANSSYGSEATPAAVELKETVPDSTTVKTDSAESKPKVPAGSMSDVKNIYKSAKDDDGEWTWVDKYPEDAEEAAENEETEQYAVVVKYILALATPLILPVGPTISRVTANKRKRRSTY